MQSCGRMYENDYPYRKKDHLKIETKTLSIDQHMPPVSVQISLGDRKVKSSELTVLSLVRLADPNSHAAIYDCGRRGM